MKFFKFRANKILIGLFLLIYLTGYAAAALLTNVKVDYVYKVCPVFTVYVDDIDNNSAGVNKGIVNFIKHINKDTDIEDHEMIHAKQCYRTFYLSTIIAHFSQSWLAKCEAEAYSIQLTSIHSIKPYAMLIQESYSPDVPLEQIESYLRNYFEKKEHIINE